MATRNSGKNEMNHFVGVYLGHAQGQAIKVDSIDLVKVQDCKDTVNFNLLCLAGLNPTDTMRWPKEANQWHHL